MSERRRRKEPLKLNSFPPSPKRSHGGHGSTLPSGSLKLLISFSYSNDFSPSSFHPSPHPSCFSDVVLKNWGHKLKWSLLKTFVFALNFDFKAPVWRYLLVMKQNEVTESPLCDLVRQTWLLCATSINLVMFSKAWHPHNGVSVTAEHFVCHCSLSWEVVKLSDERYHDDILGAPKSALTKSSLQEL